jgi:hypothetical protein
MCCSGFCAPAGTTADGRPILRCAADSVCLEAGELCAGGANCCPVGGGDFGCETAFSGLNRCFGGEGGCVLPGHACTSTPECCAVPFASIQCQAGPGGNDVCCLANGQFCAFGDVCCSGLCAPDPGGNLGCASACVAAGVACTTSADCCAGCCLDGLLGRVCTSDCDGCTLGQLGEACSGAAPCCPGLTCGGDVEYPTCRL